MMLPNTATMTRRILRAYDTAPFAAMADGAAWYSAARHHAERLAREHGVTPEQSAAVIAALSPRTQWSVNLLYADRVLRAYAAGETSPPRCGLTSNTAAAWRALHGAPLSGNKVRAFCANITGDSDAVTVDTWAGYIATRKRAASFTAKQYAAIATAYRNAARRRNVAPCQIQAITWVAVRGRAA